jgi:hypothetical protein
MIWMLAIAAYVGNGIFWWSKTRAYYTELEKSDLNEYMCDPLGRTFMEKKTATFVSAALIGTLVWVESLFQQEEAQG